MKRRTQIIVLVIAAVIALCFALYSRHERSKKPDEEFRWHEGGLSFSPHSFAGDRCFWCGLLLAE